MLTYATVLPDGVGLNLATEGWAFVARTPILPKESIPYLQEFMDTSGPVAGSNCKIEVHKQCSDSCTRYERHPAVSKRQPA